jgi:glycine/D-amino acid oxidase-like deaminating enzyme
MGFRISPRMLRTACSSPAKSLSIRSALARTAAGLVLVVLGPRFNTGQEGDVAGHFRKLEDWVREHFRIRDVGWRWSNEDMDTADRLAFVGLAPKRDPGFYVATGFNAWGITNGTAAGILCRPDRRTRQLVGYAV